MNQDIMTKGTCESKCLLQWWGKVDSNHRSDYATDLQSAPIGHSGIPPYRFYKNIPRFSRKAVELVDGLEPPTC